MSTMYICYIHIKSAFIPYPVLRFCLFRNCPAECSKGEDSLLMRYIGHNKTFVAQDK